MNNDNQYQNLIQRCLFRRLESANVYQWSHQSYTSVYRFPDFTLTIIHKGTIPTEFAKYAQNLHNNEGKLLTRVILIKDIQAIAYLYEFDNEVGHCLDAFVEYDEYKQWGCPEIETLEPWSSNSKNKKAEEENVQPR